MLRQEQDWKARESGILALGAISEGCASGLLHYLADMVSALLPLLTDTRPLVRSITCWALSRYSRWIVDNGREPQSQGQRQMEAVIQVHIMHAFWPHLPSLLPALQQSVVISGLSSRILCAAEIGAKLEAVIQVISDTQNLYYFGSCHPGAQHVCLLAAASILAPCTAGISPTQEAVIRVSSCTMGICITLEAATQVISCITQPYSTLEAAIQAYHMHSGRGFRASSLLHEMSLDLCFGIGSCEI